MSLRRVRRNAALPTLAKMQWLRGRVDPAVRDWWPVLLVAVLTQVNLSPLGPLASPPLVPVLLGLAAAVPLRWRREHPVAVIAAISAGLGCYALAGLTPSFAWFAAVLLACYFLGQHAALRRALTGLVAPAVAVGLVFVTAPTARPEELVFPLFYLGGAWAAGRVVRRRHELAGRLAGLVEALERERDEKSALAAEAERQRIAREVHDVVAHSLGIILVHAEAAEELLDRAGADVRRPLSVIQSTARQSLEEIRGVLGGMRADRAPASLDLAGLPALVQRFQHAGVDVTLQLVGPPGSEHVPPPVQAATYRLVQEALTNVLRHARGARVTVRLSRDDRGVEVFVRDDGHGRSHRPAELSSPGYGLAGMRERVVRLGGELSTGATDDGGFAVQARLPVQRTALR